MERAFIVGVESKYFKDFTECREMRNKQIEFIEKIFKDLGIETTKYRIGGNGLCGTPFKESFKSEIGLSIVPTENDKEKFGKFLNKPSEYGTCRFKKTSQISKDFAQKCVDEKIVINIVIPRVGDYFESLRKGLYGCAYSQFTYDGTFYLKVSSEHLKEDTPTGFEEIKLSQFYKVMELSDVQL